MRSVVILALGALIAAVGVSATVQQPVATPAPVNPWPAGKKPAFCNQQGCPIFDTIANCSDSNFTVRRYPAQEFVSIDFEGPAGSTYDVVGYEAFNYLFRYITGANDQSAKIDMTDPVTIDIFAGDTPTCNSTFRVSFFIPFKWQGKAPKPTEPRVYLRTTNETTVAVRSFPGFASGDWSLVVSPEFKALANSIDGTGITVKNRLETVAQYDGPYQFFHRHNEVWFYVDNAADKSNWQC